MKNSSKNNFSGKNSKQNKKHFNFHKKNGNSSKNYDNFLNSDNKKSVNISNENDKIQQMFFQNHWNSIDFQ